MSSIFQEYFKSPRKLRSVVALSLSALSLVVIGVGYQLNMYQTQLHTQVLVKNSVGEEEQMIFRDYRDQQVVDLMQLLEDCEERNALFGDGTGALCELYETQLECVESAMSQDSVLKCVTR